MTTFNFKTALDGAAGEVKQPKSVVKFGDGYEQRRTEGIHASAQTWSLQSIGIRAEIDAVKAFLDARGAIESFNWVAPGGQNLKVVLDDGYKLTPKGANIWALNYTFRQVFE